MTEVMDEIYDRYLDKQILKFTVDSAHKALIMLLEMELFNHAEVTIVNTVKYLFLRGWVVGLSVTNKCIRMDSR